MLNILKICIICIVIYHSYQKERKLKHEINMHAIYDRKEYVTHIKALKQALNH